jgi:hypothetical protein
LPASRFRRPTEAISFERCGNAMMALSIAGAALG